MALIRVRDDDSSEGLVHFQGWNKDRRGRSWDSFASFGNDTFSRLREQKFWPWLPWVFLGETIIS
jgi:hypothetical protein